MAFLPSARIYVLSVTASFFLSGCKETRTELSDLKHDLATVVNKEHHPAWMQPIPISLGQGGTTFTYILHSEHNYVVFQGKIRFNIDNENIFQRFKERDRAEVQYREKYRLTFDDKDGDGKKELVKTELTDYVFVEALPAK